MQAPRKQADVGAVGGSFFWTLFKNPEKQGKLCTGKKLTAWQPRIRFRTRNKALYFECFLVKELVATYLIRSITDTATRTPGQLIRLNPSFVDKNGRLF